MPYRQKISMDNSIYDILLGLPLFQGLSQTEFEQILSKVRLEFSTVQAGVTFVNAGEQCGNFVFILKGNVTSRRSTADGRLTLIEHIDAPLFIEPYSMFGMRPVYCKSYTAVTTTGILRIDKQYLYSELYKYNTCRMSLLNLLSGRIQALEADKWDLRGTTLRERMAKLFGTLSDNPAALCQVIVRMEDLAEILGETRLNVSKALNALQAEGRITLRRGAITVLPTATQK